MNPMPTASKTQDAFVEAFFDVTRGGAYEVIKANGSWTSPHDGMTRMLKRFVNGETAVFPYRSSDHIQWLVLQPVESVMKKHVEELKHFLIPVFAEQQVQRRKLFLSSSPIDKWGAHLFPAGYFSFRSPLSEVDSIWSMLILWIRLDEKRPEITFQESEESLFFLRNRFQQAITLQNWDVAANALHRLESKRYLSDENLKFLTIRWLASQGRWDDIWRHEDYRLIAGFEPLPLRVKSAMVTAFYHATLLVSDMEGQFDRSLATFTEYRSGLGTLLRSQMGMEEDVLLRVFAYQAAQEGHLEKLQRYRTKTIDETTLQVIDYLIAMLAEETRVTPVEKPEPSRWERANKHFKLQEYEDVYLLMLQEERSVTKVRMLCLLALMSETDEICRVALSEYSQLSEQEQQDLRRDPASKGAVHFVLARGMGGTSLEVLQETLPESLPNNWLQWFQALVQRERAPDDLYASLERMAEQSDNLPATFAHLNEMAEQLIEVSVDSFDPLRRTLLQTAIPMFANELLQSANFPQQPAKSVYEFTRMALVQHTKWNETNTGLLLRLTEGLLTLDLTDCEGIWAEVETWMTRPTIQSLAPYALEALELFKENGLQAEKMRGVWTQWASGIVDRPLDYSRSTLETWFQLGQLCQGDYDLIQRLEIVLRQENWQDPIASLAQQVITIYSLREKAANRAAARIMERNSSLRVHVCTDDRMSEQAKSYARNSNVIIVVTTCMSHALTYGISPYMQTPPLYPRSSGETGILEVLEAYARVHMNQAG